MAITKSARDGLGVRVSGHEDMGHTITTRSGLLKTKMGLIIQPSTFRGDTKGGPLAAEYEKDQGAKPETPKEEIILPEEEAPELEPETTETNQPKQQLTAVSPTLKTVRLEITVEGFGMIPSRYTHCYIGNGVMVLGLTEDSYIPQAARHTDSGIQGALTINKAPGRRYAYGENNFPDSNKTRNIILVEIPMPEGDN